MTTTITIPGAIRRRMTSLGTTVEQLAAALGITVEQVVDRLDGREEFNVGELFTASRTLGCTMGELAPGPIAPRSVRLRREPGSVREQLLDHGWSVWESSAQTAPGPLLAALRDACWALEDALDYGRADVGGEVVALAQAVAQVRPFG